MSQTAPGIVLGARSLGVKMHRGCFFAGAGAGIGTGFAGMSAAAIANRASGVTLNRVVGIVMILTSIVILLVNYVF